jgi:hypothetical protein
MQNAVNAIIQDESTLLGLANIKNYDDYTFNHSVMSPFMPSLWAKGRASPRNISPIWAWQACSTTSARHEFRRRFSVHALDILNTFITGSTAIPSLTQDKATIIPITVKNSLNE